MHCAIEEASEQRLTGGVRAFAITGSPPPVTAPSTTANLRLSSRFGTSVARYVISALSLNAVSSVAPTKSGSSGQTREHRCDPPSLQSAVDDQTGQKKADQQRRLEVRQRSE